MSEIGQSNNFPAFPVTDGLVSFVDSTYDQVVTSPDTHIKINRVNSSAGQILYTTDTPHGLSVGEEVLVTGVSLPGLNGLIDVNAIISSTIWRTNILAVIDEMPADARQARVDKAGFQFPDLANNGNHTILNPVGGTVYPADLSTSTAPNALPDNQRVSPLTFAGIHGLFTADFTGLVTVPYTIMIMHSRLLLATGTSFDSRTPSPVTQFHAFGLTGITAGTLIIPAAESDTFHTDIWVINDPNSAYYRGDTLATEGFSCGGNLPGVFALHADKDLSGNSIGFVSAFAIWDRALTKEEAFSIGKWAQLYYRVT